jgi:hypothetical protein
MGVTAVKFWSRWVLFLRLSGPLGSNIASRQVLLTISLIATGDSTFFNVAVLITNGASDYDQAVREAQLFRDTGATLVSIGKYNFRWTYCHPRLDRVEAHYFQQTSCKENIFSIKIHKCVYSYTIDTLIDTFSNLSMVNSMVSAGVIQVKLLFFLSWNRISFVTFESTKLIPFVNSLRKTNLDSNVNIFTEQDLF